MIYPIIYHDILLVRRRAVLWCIPLAFFLVVVTLFVIAVGPDTKLLAHIAPGIVWVGAMLASLLSLNTLFQEDADDGVLSLYIISPRPLITLVISKTISHWLIFGLPLLLLSPLLGLMLGLDAPTNTALFYTLALGTPILSLLGALGAGLTVGLRNSSVLLPLLLLPLTIPVLVFAIGTVTAASSNMPTQGYYGIMGAILLLTLVFAPLATTASLKIGQHF